MMVTMKYVRHSVVGFVLWPDTDSLCHTDVAEAISNRIKEEAYHYGKSPSLAPGCVISAGLAIFGPRGQIMCHGKSEPLGIGAKDEDSDLLAKQLNGD